MGSCQNYGPFWGTLYNRCRIIIRTQKGTIILTTTHIAPRHGTPWPGRILSGRLARGLGALDSALSVVHRVSLGFGFR